MSCRIEVLNYESGGGGLSAFDLAREHVVQGFNPALRVLSVATSVDKRLVDDRVDLNAWGAGRAKALNYERGRTGPRRLSSPGICGAGLRAGTTLSTLGAGC